MMIADIMEDVQKLVDEVVKELNPTKDSVQRAIVSRQFRRRLRQLIVELTAEFYVLLSDDEAVVWIMGHGGLEEEARRIVLGFRGKARALGVKEEVKIHADVHPGGIYQKEIPRMEPDRILLHRLGWNEFQRLEGWDFPDPPTEKCLVSWIPRPLDGTIWKSAAEQMELVLAFKTEVNLPAWYRISFGSVNHIGGMSLAHFEATGTDPFNNKVVRTDTRPPLGFRLRMAWFNGNPYYSSNYLDATKCHSIAVFAIGVIKAQQA